MPAYGIAQPGYNVYPNQGLNLTSVISGESFTLFDGTETAAQGLKSVAFTRGPAPGIVADNGITFYVSGGPAGAVVEIEGANINADGDYVVLNSITLDANGNGAYTDIGRASFFRAVLSTYTSGPMPIVTAQR